MDNVMWWQINWSAKYWCCLIFISWEPLWSPDWPYWMPQHRKHQGSCLLFYYFNFESTQNVNWEKSNDLNIQASSVQFSHSVMSDSATPWTAARQASLSFTISLSLLGLMSIELMMPSNHLILCPPPFSSFPHSFPASGSFLISWLFTPGGQSIGASASVLPMNIQDWFPLGWTGWISLQSKGLSRDFSNTTVQKHQFFSAQLSL